MNNNYEFSYKSFDKAPTIIPHFHNYYEIYMFIKGDASYSVEGNLYEMNNKDILITNGRELHSPVFKSKENYERKLIFLQQSFLSEFITERFNPFDVFEKRPLGEMNKIDNKFVKEYGVDKLFDIIEYYTNNVLPESMAMIKSSVLQMLVAFMQILKVSSQSNQKQTKVQDVIHYINENLAEDLSFEILEKKFFISKYYLSRIFKEQTGFTLGSFIANKRIIKAKELLLEQVPITEVAQLVGFNDYSNFYRTFKKITKLSPKSFK